MPDLLAHVLLAYVAFTALAWRVPPFPRRLVPVGVVGGALPDLVKVHLLVSDGVVESALGVPFSWDPIHRLGGIAVLAGLGAVLFDRPFRRQAFASLLAGGGLHLVLDSLIRRASGLSPPYLYPLTWWQPPAGDLYLSSDLWPTALAIAAAAAVFAHDRRRRARAPRRAAESQG